jgi:hypothetical protein
MKKITSFAQALFYCGLLLAAPAMICAQTSESAKKVLSRQQTVAADPAVIVVIDAERDDIKVHGWERNEVRAVTSRPAQLELRRVDNSEMAPANALAKNLQVIADRREGEMNLYVPRGAKVKIRLGWGDVSVEDVAATEIVAKFGDINLRGISESVRAVTPTLGDITLKDSSGKINLRVQSGTIKLSNVRPAVQDDGIKLNATSGNFVLEGVAHTRIEAETVSGSILLNGPTAKGTNCSLKTVTGNVTLRLLPDASFQVFIMVGEGGRVFTEFPTEALKKTVYPGSKRFTGKYGEGDSTFYLSSFNGRVHLWIKDEDKKKL